MMPATGRAGVCTAPRLFSLICPIALTAERFLPVPVLFRRHSRKNRCQNLLLSSGAGDDTIPCSMDLTAAPAADSHLGPGDLDSPHEFPTRVGSLRNRPEIGVDRPGRDSTTHGRRCEKWAFETAGDTNRNREFLDGKTGGACVTHPSEQVGRKYEGSGRWTGRS